MAEIPVERRGGAPWWVYLLGALLLLALLALLMRGCDERAVVNSNNANNSNNLNAVANGNANRNSAASNVNTTLNTNLSANTNANLAGAEANGNSRISTEGVGTATGARVTDVNLFGSTSNKETLVGRAVELQNVRVARVLSDHVFTVTSGQGEMFVMLDESLDTGGGKEQQIKARAGQTVNLTGAFRNVPTSETQQERSGGGLNRTEYRQMAGQRVYLHATSARNAG